jgi:hypothetical protein
MELGTAETAEEKKGVRRMKVQSNIRAAHAADRCWFPCIFVQQRDNRLPPRAPMRARA